MSEFEKGKSEMKKHALCLLLIQEALTISKNFSIVLWLNDKFDCESEHSLLSNDYFNYVWKLILYKFENIYFGCRTGVFTGPCGDPADGHAMTIVGYGKNGTGKDAMDYWVIKYNIKI